MRERVDVTPDPADPRGFYRLLTSVVVPRPIAWVSTRTAAGGDNLAPHSFFTVAGIDPPVVQFTSVGRKDTLRDVEHTREFVVCLVSEALTEACNDTSTDFPPGDSEFDRAGLTREPSRTVAAPRVAESPVALECRLVGTTAFGSCTVVFGEVQHAAIAADAFRDGRPAIDLLAPMARLGADEWSTIGDVTTRRRPRFRDWPRS